MEGHKSSFPGSEPLAPAHYTTPSQPSPPRSLDTRKSNNWKQLSNQAIFGAQHDLSDLAFQNRVYTLAERFHRCHVDSAVLRRKDGSLSYVRLGCGHRLCPACAKEKTNAMKRRLDVVAPLARTAITLTCRTLHDEDLREVLLALKCAFRGMTHQVKRSSAPFAAGYYWKLEITDGQGFHPHYHVLSIEPHLSIEALSARWRRLLSSADLQGGHCWITKVDQKSIREFTKYLTKSLHLIHPTRWPDLLHGLAGLRVYGSGGPLRVPPPPPKSATFLGRASDLFHAPDATPEIRAFIARHRLLPILIPEVPENVS